MFVVKDGNVMHGYGSWTVVFMMYRDSLKGWYVVERYFVLALLRFSAWPCPAMPGCSLAKFAILLVHLCYATQVARAQHRSRIMIES